MPNTFTFACASALLIASAARAQDAKPDAQPNAQTDEKKPAKTMAVGDAAPAIDIAHWVIGDKVAAFDDGKVYVVEFWATWCGPCRTSMPHITSLQKDYKDYGVTFIGISDEPLETVTKWLDTTDKKSQKKWSEIIGYTLTTDPDKSVMADYFTAAGRTGIPSAFIVGKDQHIEWIGHPMQIDKPLDAVVKDSWDRAKFKASYDSEQAMPKALQAKDWKKVIELADATLANDPKNKAMAMLKFQTLAGPMNDSAKAYAFLKEYLPANFWDDPMTLNEYAWTIVDDPAIKERDVEYALGLAMRANKYSGESNPAILDTLARCWHDKGNLGEAVKIQKQAAALAQDDQMGTEIKATLKKYEEEWSKKNGG